MSYCSVKSCRSRLKRGVGISFFRYPRDFDRLQIWVQYSKRGRSFEPRRHHKICSLHFSAAQIDRDPDRLADLGYINAKRRLKDDAVPDIPFDATWHGVEVNKNTASKAKLREGQAEVEKQSLSDHENKNLRHKFISPLKMPLAHETDTAIRITTEKTTCANSITEEKIDSANSITVEKTNTANSIKVEKTDTVKSISIKMEKTDSANSIAVENVQTPEITESVTVNSNSNSISLEERMAVNVKCKSEDQTDESPSQDHVPCPLSLNTDYLKTDSDTDSTDISQINIAGTEPDSQPRQNSQTKRTVAKSKKRKSYAELGTPTLGVGKKLRHKFISSLIMPLTSDPNTGNPVMLQAEMTGDDLYDTTACRESFIVNPNCSISPEERMAMHKTEVQTYERRDVDGTSIPCPVSLVRNVGAAYQGYIDKHYIQDSQDSQKYVCKLCGKTLMHSTTLHVHNCKKYQKSNRRKAVCEVCGKIYATTYTLKVHMRVHDEARIYKCPLCPKAFRHDSSLKVHMRTHTGERPYVCNECGRSFIDASGLKYHRFNSHMLTLLENRNDVSPDND